jgi:hypothetical protein
LTAERTAGERPRAAKSGIDSSNADISKGCGTIFGSRGFKGLRSERDSAEFGDFECPRRVEPFLRGAFALLPPDVRESALNLRESPFLPKFLGEDFPDFESFADDLRDFEPSFFEEKIFFPIFAIFLNKFMKGQNKIKQCNWLQAISFLIGAKIGKAKKTQQDANGDVK